MSSVEEARLVEIPFPPHKGIEIVSKNDSLSIFACHSLLKDTELITYFPRELQRAGWRKKVEFMSDEEFLAIYEKPMSLITVRFTTTPKPIVHFYIKNNQ